MNLLKRLIAVAAIALALPAWADLSRDDAAAAAQRMTGGRVLSVEKSDEGGRPVWRVKVVTGRGRGAGWSSSTPRAGSPADPGRGPDGMRLLLIEDDAALRLGLARQLEADGYRVDQAADGEDGLFQAREYPVDLAIVDLGLPKLSGLMVVQRLRADGRALPILILTARGSWQDKVVGLEAGADDYLVKPFEYPELAARVKALLRRSLKATSDVLTVGPLAIDFSAQVAQTRMARPWSSRPSSTACWNTWCASARAW